MTRFVANGRFELEIAGRPVPGARRVCARPTIRRALRVKS